MAGQAPDANLLSEAAFLERLASIRSSLDRARADWGELGELTLEGGLTLRETSLAVFSTLLDSQDRPLAER